MYTKDIRFHTGRCHARPAMEPLLDLVRAGSFEPELVTGETAAWDDAAEAVAGHRAKLVISRVAGEALLGRLTPPLAAVPVAFGRSAAICGCWKSRRIESSEAKKKNAPAPCFRPESVHAAAVAAEVLVIAMLALGFGVLLKEIWIARLLEERRACGFSFSACGTSSS